VLEDLNGIDDHRRRRLARGDLGSYLPNHIADLPLEVANSSLACVIGHDLVQRVVRELDLVLGQPVPYDLSLDEMRPSYCDLFGFRVAVEADDLHPVEQGAWDRLDDVPRRDEEDLREV
jgi:hypothetical protein